MITNVYIDGMNLFYGCLKGTPYKWLDLVALSRSLMPEDTIKTAHYFTARVSTRPSNPGGHQRQDQYLRALSTLPEIAIHFGHYRRDVVRMAVASPPPNTIEVIKTEEKGSDVNLATYLLRDAFRQECEIQVVISNDSDLAEPIRVVRKELRMPVTIVNPHRPERRTRLLSGDALKQIRPAMLETSQLPAIVKESAGIVTRPQGW